MAEAYRFIAFLLGIRAHCFESSPSVRIPPMKSSVALYALLLPALIGCRNTDSFSLQPGQRMEVANHSHRRISIRADYAVSIAGGHCFAARVVEINLYCDPSNFVITDIRPSFLVWARANQVTVTSQILEF